MATTQYRDNDNKPEAHLIHQWVSPPIFQMRGLELNAGNNMYLAIGVRVVSNDGGTVRGTILSVTPDDNELPTLQMITSYLLVH
jgi:hypothetical protein